MKMETKDFKWNKKTNATDMWQPSTRRSYSTARSDREIIGDPKNTRQEHVIDALGRATLELMDMMESLMMGDTSSMDKLRKMMEEVAISKWEDANIKGTGEMTEDELAKHFAGPTTQAVVSKKQTNLDTLEGIRNWEDEQDNSTDLYKIKARIQNEASAAANANLTPQGEMLVNCFTHVIKAFYDFADKITDPRVRNDLRILIKSKEDMPARFMAGIHGTEIKARKEKDRGKKVKNV
jgi:hypothetical protein